MPYGARTALHGHGPRAYQFRRLLQTQLRHFDKPIQLRLFSVPRHLEHLIHAPNRNSDNLSHTPCSDSLPAVWYHVDSHLVFYLSSPNFVTARLAVLTSMLGRATSGRLRAGRGALHLGQEICHVQGSLAQSCSPPEEDSLHPPLFLLLLTCPGSGEKAFPLLPV